MTTDGEMDRFERGATTPDGMGPTTVPEDSGATAPTEPVRMSTLRADDRPMIAPRARRGSRARWAIASIVTILVLLVSTAGFMILSAGAATSALVGYVPGGSVGYLEIRLDAPGDQRQNAANLLSHFPGFADQSTLGTKLNEALDQIVSQTSAGKQNFTGNVKGWLGDSVAVAMTRIPARPVSGVTHEGAGLLLVSVNDPASARGWAETTFGPGTGAETYAGIPLTMLEKHGMTFEFGVVSNVLLVGDPTSVHAAIDSKGAGTFADSASFKAAAAAVPGDRLAFGYLDLRGLTDAIGAARATPTATTALMLDQLPAWVAVTVRAESDSLSATVALPPTNLAPVASNHTSVLATRLPANTLAAAEIHDLATLIGSVTTTLRNSPDTQGGQNQIDKALQALGGLDALVGWMGDASIAVVQSGPADIAAGVVIQAKDADTAAAKLVQIKNLVSLLGASAGLKVVDETYNGTTITIIDLGDLSRLGQGTTGQPGLASFSGIDVKIAVAQSGDLVVAGLDTAFVKAVLDTKPGVSLADQDSYRNALDRAGASNTGQFYLDLRTVLDLATRRLPADAFQRYASDIKPYLDPFRAFAASGSAGDPNRARFVITVK